MRTISLLATLLLGLFFLGCDKSDIEYENAFEKSHKAWLEFKAASNNSYRYVVTAATWAGASWRTTITVENGQVTGRDFQYDSFSDFVMPPGGWTEESVQEILDSAGKTAEEYVEMTGHELGDVLQWSEAPDEVGTNENNSAAGVRTLDEIYDLARTVWLKKRSDAKTSFEAKNNGLISSCGFVPDGCQDDCFSGISIASIAAL